MIADNAQTCPQRFREAGPQVREQLIDTWETDRWSPGVESPSSKVWENGVEKILSTHVGWPTKWGTPPRSCSFCGSGHARDVLEFITDKGWEIELTGKRYKFYVVPPGTHLRYQDVIQNLSKLHRIVHLSTTKNTTTPVPPIKMYVWHMTEDQIALVNKLISEHPEWSPS